MAATTATTTMAVASSKVENPKNPTDLNLTPPSTEDALTTEQSPSSGGEGDEAKVTSGAVAVKASDVDGGGAATDIQKKMKRAERFGVAVQLSEKEKRNSRAERFGTGPTGPSPDGLDSTKQSEELKRKARAERFGIVQSVAPDEDVKKKARLARFGSSVTDSAEVEKKKASSVTDSVEEEKKKARALRFSQSGSSLKTNGKGDTEVKTTTGDQAGGDT